MYLQHTTHTYTHAVSHSPAHRARCPEPHWHDECMPSDLSAPSPCTLIKTPGGKPPHWQTPFAGTAVPPSPKLQLVHCSADQERQSGPQSPPLPQLCMCSCRRGTSGARLRRRLHPHQTACKREEWFSWMQLVPAQGAAQACWGAASRCVATAAAGSQQEWCAAAAGLLWTGCGISSSR
jgi:hypothetical protein